MMTVAETKELSITPKTLLDEVTKLKHSGYRLVQICCVKVEDQYEMIYSFGIGYDLLNMRYQVTENTKINSISHIFPSAYFYENEVHDLFGVPVEFMTHDFKGNLYRTAVKTPYK